MEATLNQEAILAMLAGRLKQLTASIGKAKSEDELAEIAENIAAAGKAAHDSIERACEEGSLSGYKAAMSLRALGDALEGTALLLLLRGMQLKTEEEKANE